MLHMWSQWRFTRFTPLASNAGLPDFAIPARQPSRFRYMKISAKSLTALFAAAFAAAVVLVPPAMAEARASAKEVEVVVYKDPNCGCCKSWVTHLRKHGFKVTSHDTREMSSIKSNFGVKDELQSCHTAMVGGYVIEGHVPAADIKRLLKQRPKIAGLAVPGMPAGSPGMESSTPEKYEVIAFQKGGATKVFARH